MPGTSKIEHFRLVTSNQHQLSADQQQLFDLVLAAGFTIHPQIFKVLMEMLTMNVPPHAILGLLREVSDKIPHDRPADINENLPLRDQRGGNYT